MDVASGVVLLLGGVARRRQAEGVDEVKLQSVDVPRLHRLHVGFDEKRPHLGETRVENRRALAGHLVNEILALELHVVGALEADEWDRIPDHVLHPKVVHLLHVRSHVGESASRDLPVAAKGIAASGVIRLPPVIENDRLHPKSRGNLELLLKGLRKDVLMEAVPAGIKRVERGRGRGRDPVAASLLDPRGAL